MNISAEFSIATAEESQKIDSETVNSFGIDECTLMEVAGISAAKKILKKTDTGSAGVFLCGKGNNGGDALVVARYLIQHGIKAAIVFVGGDDALSATAQKNYALLKKIAKSGKAVSIDFYTKWLDFDQRTIPDFIIDGMLGTGLGSKLRGDYPEAVQWANETGAPIYAMDIPTGLHADSGKVMGQAISASQTFAFGVLKQGFYLEQGYELTGEITFCELPFPHYLNDHCSSFLIDDAWLTQENLTPARHKYEAGVVYVIAGSEGLTGAAIMAAKSAWAEGAGAVILICPRGLVSVFENNLPQIIKKPVGAKDDLHFKDDNLKDVLQIVEEKSSVVLIGPGMGRNESTVNFINQFLSKCMNNCVIDADALWALSQQEKWKKPESSSWILTPHTGELSHLLHDDFKNDLDRLKAVQKIAQEKEIHLLSKGFPIILGTPNRKTYLSGYDTRIFSRAGFGDILAGKIAACWSMNYNPEISCCRALLAGYKKVALLKNETPLYIPEPFDLI